MVELFFTLSGFGMMMGYYEIIANGKINFKDYILSRIKKLYPLFIFGTLFTIIFEVLYNHKMENTFIYPNFDLYHLLLNVLLLQDGYFGTDWSFDSPSWCISIVVFCYVIFFFIVNIFKKEEYVYYIYGILAIISYAIINANLNYPIFNELMARGMCCYSMGILFYEFFFKMNIIIKKYVGLFQCH